MNLFVYLKYFIQRVLERAIYKYIYISIYKKRIYI